ncbi:hypothetical protein RBWH47_03938 [Rhodopirellula baltica WH47]|uniref:Uncharacterized protein n=1 Tax=Rhodopirellula baltica WH47 TaxID=991778 RepID=F2ATR5_RHOBT|nr:hypothetical protein RBWH47_03938 [Rhodopirellula baltica WH47]
MSFAAELEDRWGYMKHGLRWLPRPSHLMRLMGLSSRDQPLTCKV